jgi:hypothetical protein
MSNIPYAREVLKSALAMDDARDVRAAIELALGYMTRQTYTRKADVTSGRVTPEVKSMVHDYAAENPDASMQSIGNMFNINIGRVSEILAGKR